MTTLLLAALLVTALGAIVAAGWRLVVNDGGPRHEPLPRAEEDWFPDLPSHPYATNR